MTILKEGTPKTYIYECGECGCIFTGDSSEVDTDGVQKLEDFGKKFEERFGGE